MANASTDTKLCLQTFADYMGIHPLSFNSISLSACTDIIQPCEAWMQFGWQNSNFISREALARYIHEAEVQIEHYLKMFVAPTWTSDVHPWPHFYRQEYGKFPTPTFTTDWRNVIKFGQPKKTLIATVNVELFDRDSDGFFETAQIDYMTDTPYDLCELYLVYPNKNGDKAWEVCVTLEEFIEGGIRWETPSWNVVDEQFLNTSFLRTRYIDGCENTFYQSVLELWEESKDDCKAEVEMIWKNPVVCSRYNCEELIVPACALSIDKCNGYFTVGEFSYSEDCNITVPKIPCELPDYIKVFYQSGCGECSGVCDLLATPIVKLAASKIPAQLCDCTCFIKEINRLQLDTGLTSDGADLRYTYPFEVRNNPFGTTVGAIETFIYLSNIYDTLC